MKYCTCNRRVRRRNPPGRPSPLMSRPVRYHTDFSEPSGRPWGWQPGNTGRRRTAGPRSGGLRATRGFLDDPIEGRSGLWQRHRPRRVKPKKPETLDDIRLHSDSRFSRGYSGWGRRRRNRRFRYNPCSSDHKRSPRRFNPEFNVTPVAFDHGVTFKRSRSTTDREPDIWDQAVEKYEARWGSLGGSQRRLRRRNPGFDSPFSPIYRRNSG